MHDDFSYILLYLLDLTLPPRLACFFATQADVTPEACKANAVHLFGHLPLAKKCNYERMRLV